MVLNVMNQTPCARGSKKINLLNKKRKKHIKSHKVKQTKRASQEQTKKKKKKTTTTNKVQFKFLTAF